MRCQCHPFVVRDIWSDDQEEPRGWVTWRRMGRGKDTERFGSGSYFGSVWRSLVGEPASRVPTSQLEAVETDSGLRIDNWDENPRSAAMIN